MARKNVSAKNKKRSPLSRDLMLETAIALADREGLAGLSMRRLADCLGVEAMSLYHHVAGKDQILDMMVDAIFAEIAREWDPPAGTADWKTAMQLRAFASRTVLLRHPWALGLLESRPNPGPATLAHHDTVLGCLLNSGFSIDLAAHAFAALDSYTYGFVLQESNLPFQTGGELQNVADTMLAQMPAGEYPHLTEMIRYALRPDYAFANEFEIGLGLILDGLERMRRPNPGG